MITSQDVLQMSYEHVILQGEPSIKSNKVDGKVQCSYYQQNDSKILLCGAAIFLVDPSYSEDISRMFCSISDLALTEIKPEFRNFINLMEKLQVSHDNAAADAAFSNKDSFLDIYRINIQKILLDWNKNNPNDPLVYPLEPNVN